MGQHHGGGIGRYRKLKDLPWMHQNRIERAL